MTLPPSPASRASAVISVRGVDRGGAGAREVALALVVAADADGAAAGRAAGVEGGAGELDGVAGDGDRAAALRSRRGRGDRGEGLGARGGAGVEPAGDADAAAAAAAEDDGAGAAADAARLDDAGEVDHLAGHLPGGGGLDLDAAAVGGEPAAVGDERAVVVAVGRHGHLQEAVAGEVERRLLAGAEADPAHAGGDRAGVVDLAADQRRVAARADLDRALVDHGGGPALAPEAAPAGDEVLVGGGEGRGHEGAGADGAGRGDRDAVRVDRGRPGRWR